MMAYYRSIKPLCELVLNQSTPMALRLKAQAQSLSLCLHQEQPIFQLKPDLLLIKERRWVLHTKWKRLDASNRADKYGLRESDFYQMLAYGQRYMGAVGDMALIYPRSKISAAPLHPFAFSPTMHVHVHVLPFDLSNDDLLGWEVLGFEALRMA